MTDKYKLSQSRAIEVLRFPLSVLVVAIHCYFIKGLYYNNLTASGGGWIINVCSIIITDCAVPLFFVISGYLYFVKGYNKLEYKKKTKRKLFTLIIPYLCWNIIWILTNPTPFIEAPVLKKIIGFWTTDFCIYGWTGPWNGPLWFIRDLFVVMLFAPIIWNITNKHGLLLPACFSFLYIIGYEALCPGLSTVSFLFFCFGAYLAIKRPYFSKFLQHGKVFYILCLIGSLLLILRIYTFISIPKECSTLINLSWILVSMSIYYGIAVLIGNATNNFKIWKLIGASSFVIFAMHSIIVGRVSSLLRLLFHADSQSSNIKVLSIYFTTIIITVAICFCFHLIITKNKVLSKLLEGGRKR